MLDIDFFKSVNDTYGHDAGDEVLKATSELIQQHFSEQFLAARLGGEEFSIFFDDTELTDAIKRLEAFRTAFENQQVRAGKDTLKCTVSIGVTSSCESNLDALINKADELLYEAKETGRNKVVSHLSGEVLADNRVSNARTENRE
jgi:diguanylate cyclase (GGDEF)-like protein